MNTFHQSRVKEAIRQVEEVQELKQCITSMQDAMLRRDYDEAATLLHQSFNVDRSILEGSFAEYTVPTSENPDNPSKTISDIKAVLFDIFSQRFDSAVSNRDQKEITRYFKLFPLIGCYTEGLERYSNFVCGLVRNQGSESLRMNKGLYYIAKNIFANIYPCDLNLLNSPHYPYSAKYKLLC
jgi:hypothetical protein